MPYLCEELELGPEQATGGRASKPTTTPSGEYVPKAIAMTQAGAVYWRGSKGGEVDVVMEENKTHIISVPYRKITYLPAL